MPLLIIPLGNISLLFYNACESYGVCKEDKELDNCRVTMGNQIRRFTLSSSFSKN